MRQVDEILRLLHQRKQLYAVQHQRMAEFAQVYNGDKTTVLPELHRNEKPAVPNLIQQHTDQLAMRVASTAPVLYFPALRPGIGKSERLARIRKEVMGGLHEANKLRHLTRQRARQLIGMGMQPTWVRYRSDLQRPMWDLCNPQHAYPPAGGWDNPVVPPDMIFCYVRPLWWLLLNYPDRMAYLRVGESTRDTLFELVHYIDAEQNKLVVIGKGRAPENGAFVSADIYGGGSDYVVLEGDSYVNETGLMPVTCAQRIGIDRVNGAHDASIGLYERQGRMMALEEIAAERSIFPDPWLEPLDASTTPRVVVPADGRQGIVGIIAGGHLNSETMNPNLAALQIVDRGERAIRSNVGIPPDWGGESGSNIRTGRRGDSIVSSTVDFHVQEYQELLAEALAHEDRVAIAQDRVYGAGRSKTIAVGFGGGGKLRTYTPADLWETDEHYVKYPAPGSDAAALNVQLAQKVGTGEMSMRTAREIDPMIDDPDQEERRVLVEQLERGVLAEFGQPGSFGLPDKARAMQLLITGKADTLVDAIMTVQQEAQERQSADVNPAAPGSPEAQPGIVPPGQGAEAGGPIAQPTPSLENLAALFRDVRGPSRLSPVEAGAA